MNLKVTEVPIGQIKPYDKNPRKNNEAVEYVAASIREFGFKQPIVVDREGVIIAGHTRYKAALKLGLKQVPVLYATDLSEAQVKAYRLADNKTAEFSGWNASRLAEELVELCELEYDIGQFGFADWEPGEVEEDDFDVDEALEKITEPEAKRGDIYRLGRHRVMCGDANSAEDCVLLMDGKQAHIVWTDPPWNVGYGSSDHPSWKTGADRQILNDSMSTEEFADFLSKSFANMREVLCDGAMVYVVMSAQEWGTLMLVMNELGFHWSSTIIWNKDHFVLSRKDYHTKYEPVWYGWLGSDKRLCPLKDREQSDVWDIDRPVSSPEHPTMKPIELIAKALMNSSRKSDIVIDFFGGSGSTLIAAEKTGRTCYMMELDPKYLDVICKRYEELTGEKGVKI